MGAQSRDPDRYTEVRNAKAGRDYFIEEKFEAGIALRGTEVKSIRGGHAQISDAFARVERGQDRALGVLAHANDEREAEARAIACVGGVEAGGLIGGEPVEPGAALLVARRRGEAPFAGDAAGRLVVPLLEQESMPRQQWPLASHHPHGSPP